MSRGDGFSIADTDTGLHSDPKVVALARRLKGGVQTLAALELYEGLRLASWRLGKRVTMDEALPAWLLDDVSDLAAALTEVGLIDRDGRLPEKSWAGWFGPALERRQGADFGRIVGGLRVHGMSEEAARAEARRRQEAEKARLLIGGQEPDSESPDMELNSKSRVGQAGTDQPSDRPAGRPAGPAGPSNAREPNTPAADPDGPPAASEFRAKVKWPPVADKVAS